jgi:intracellular multiplication protein IcmP
LLEQIATSAKDTKQLDFSGVRELVAKYSQSKSLIWVLKRHAYRGTMLASLLEIARTDGVLATSEFLWLKPVDRQLWYMLNSVGRQTAFIEVSGLFAHWLAEKAFKCPLKTPMVREAVIGLQAAIESTLYKQENEKSWHYDATAEG